MYCMRAFVPVILTITDEPAGALIVKVFALHSVAAEILNTFCPGLLPVSVMMPYCVEIDPLVERAA